MASTISSLWMVLFFGNYLIATALGWGSSDKIKLTDVDVLTLHQGEMTTSRRTHAVPHLKCVGGSAGCSAFTARVVQCYNRGSKGFEVQWECMAEMDRNYYFGKIEVNCESYSYPGDPYVLEGSCGLEYTIDVHSFGYRIIQRCFAIIGFFVIYCIGYYIYQIYWEGNTTIYAPEAEYEPGFGETERDKEDDKESFAETERDKEDDKERSGNIIVEPAYRGFNKDCYSEWSPRGSHTQSPRTLNTFTTSGDWFDADHILYSSLNDISTPPSTYTASDFGGTRHRKPQSDINNRYNLFDYDHIINSSASDTPTTSSTYTASGFGGTRYRVESDIINRSDSVVSNHIMNSSLLPRTYTASGSDLVVSAHIMNSSLNNIPTLPNTYTASCFGGTMLR